jgi:hypothetical protein
MSISEVIKLSNLQHYLAMKTLYYSLKKASQLAGVSKERICEWEQDESNELSPAKNKSGAFLFSWDDIKVIQELKEQMSAKRGPVIENPEQTRNTSAAEKTSLSETINDDSFILSKSGKSLKFAVPPFTAQSGNEKSDISTPVSVEDTDTRELIESAEKLGGLAREALQFQNKMEVRRPRLSITPAFPDIHLASYPRDLSSREIRFLPDESNFNKDLNEIREILQELHDRL